MYLLYKAHFRGYNLQFVVLTELTGTLLKQVANKTNYRGLLKSDSEKNIEQHTFFVISCFFSTSSVINWKFSWSDMLPRHTVANRVFPIISKPWDIPTSWCKSFKTAPDFTDFPKNCNIPESVGITASKISKEIPRLRKSGKNDLLEMGKLGDVSNCQVEMMTSSWNFQNGEILLDKVMAHTFGITSIVRANSCEPVGPNVLNNLKGKGLNISWKEWLMLTGSKTLVIYPPCEILAASSPSMK